MKGEALGRALPSEPCAALKPQGCTIGEGAKKRAGPLDEKAGSEGARQGTSACATLLAERGLGLRLCQSIKDGRECAEIGQFEREVLSTTIGSDALI